MPVWLQSHSCSIVRSPSTASLPSAQLQRPVLHVCCADAAVPVFTVCCALCAVLCPLSPRWKGDGEGRFSRTFEFVQPKKGIASANAACCQEQRFSVHAGGVFVMTTDMAMTGIPYADAFRVQSFWKVRGGARAGAWVGAGDLQVGRDPASCMRAGKGACRQSATCSIMPCIVAG